jgi:diguanylate cyclase (GGDEF)-like protein
MQGWIGTVDSSLRELRADALTPATPEQETAVLEELDRDLKALASAVEISNANLEAMIVGGEWQTLVGTQQDALSPAPDWFRDALGANAAGQAVQGGRYAEVKAYLDSALEISRQIPIAIREAPPVLPDPIPAEIVEDSTTDSAVAEDEISALDAPSVLRVLSSAHAEAQIGKRADGDTRYRNGLFIAIGLCIGLVLALLSYFTLNNRRRLAWAEAHDPLTGLGNRSELEHHINMLTHAGGDQQSHAFVLIDLDRFSELNREAGSDNGDRVLQEIAERLGALLRSNDLATRVGADVFAVVCAGAGEEYIARAICDRIRHSLERPIRLPGYEDVTISTSLGVCLVDGKALSLQALLDYSGLAVRSVKDIGKGGMALFTPDLLEAHEAEARLEGELQRAIINGELVVHYQPEVDLNTAELLGVEALVRWNHPERGQLLPSTFIPVAEETGLVVPLGEWVLRKACFQAGQWQRDYPQVPMRVRVNLSARQLENADVVDMVTQAIQDADIEPSSLCLEITESAIMADAESARDLLERLAGTGVRLAIDDFGTGYSSLAYLEMFPVDVLKIDRSFVSGLETDSAKSAIISAIVALARALGLTVTAEGVETERQAAMLVELGCPRGQGFFYAKALPPESLDRLLTNHTGTGRPIVQEAAETHGQVSPAFATVTAQRASDAIRRFSTRSGDSSAFEHDDDETSIVKDEYLTDDEIGDGASSKDRELADNELLASESVSAEAGSQDGGDANERPTK